MPGMTAAIMVHDYENENPEQERHPRERGDLMAMETLLNQEIISFTTFFQLPQ